MERYTVTAQIRFEVYSPSGMGGAVNEVERQMDSLRAVARLPVLVTDVYVHREPPARPRVRDLGSQGDI
jgi:hypothetical protein